MVLSHIQGLEPYKDVKKQKAGWFCKLGHWKTISSLRLVNIHQPGLLGLLTSARDLSGTKKVARGGLLVSWIISKWGGGKAEGTPLTAKSSLRFKSRTVVRNLKCRDKANNLHCQFSLIIKGTGENHKGGNESTSNPRGKHVNKREFKHRSLKMAIDGRWNWKPSKGASTWALTMGLPYGTERQDGCEKPDVRIRELFSHLQNCSFPKR